MPTASSPPPEPRLPAASRGRAPFVPPVVEELGALATHTLQQSIPIGPGSLLSRAERTRRLP